MQIEAQQMRPIARCLYLALALLLVLVNLFSQEALAGGNKGKGGEEDIIMYNGNIVLKGDKSGGNFVLANNHPTYEEVEFSPDFFGGRQYGGEMGGYRRRRR